VIPAVVLYLIVVIGDALSEGTLMSAPLPGALSEFRLLLALAINQPVNALH
jgi:hypothetical protein